MNGFQANRNVSVASEAFSVQEPFGDDSKQKDGKIRQSWVMLDQRTDTTGFVEHPVATGPFAFDVLTRMFLYLEEVDKTTLLSVSGVCQYWRYASNILPHWRSLHKADLLPACLKRIPRKKKQPIRDHPTRDAYMRVVREVKHAEERAQQVSAREGELKDIMPLFLTAMLVITKAAFITWCIGIATNGEWPNKSQRNMGTLFSMNRFKGYPGYCLSNTCEPLKGLSTADLSKSQYMAWLCPDSQQIHDLRLAARLETAGLSVFPIAAILCCAAEIVWHAKPAWRRVTTLLAWGPPTLLVLCCTFIGVGVHFVIHHSQKRCSAVSAKDLGLETDPGTQYAVISLGAIVASMTIAMSCARLWVYSGLPFGKAGSDARRNECEEDEEDEDDENGWRRQYL